MKRGGSYLLVQQEDEGGGAGGTGGGAVTVSKHYWKMCGRHRRGIFLIYGIHGIFFGGEG